MALFSQKDKRAHYTAVANGAVPIKANSKYSAAEQLAYARGQRDARNENARIFASKNATPEQKESWRIKRAEKKAAYWAEKAAKQKKK